MCMHNPHIMHGIMNTRTCTHTNLYSNSACICTSTRAFTNKFFLVVHTHTGHTHDTLIIVTSSRVNLFSMTRYVGMKHKIVILRKRVEGRYITGQVQVWGAEKRRNAFFS